MARHHLISEVSPVEVKHLFVEELEKHVGED